MSVAAPEHAEEGKTAERHEEGVGKILPRKYRGEEEQRKADGEKMPRHAGNVVQLLEKDGKTPTQRAVAMMETSGEK